MIIECIFEMSECLLNIHLFCFSADFSGNLYLSQGHHLPRRDASIFTRLRMLSHSSMIVVYRPQITHSQSLLSTIPISHPATSQVVTYQTCRNQHAEIKLHRGETCTDLVCRL